jgi:serine/threonine protein kinase HipA of HipAB toxin-antitoxin module
MSDQNRHSIRTRGSVTEIPTNARSALNLDAADNRRRVNQSGVGRTDFTVVIQSMAGGSGADPETRGRIERQLIKFSDSFYIYYPIEFPAARP